MTTGNTVEPNPPLWLAMLLAAMAGGTAWGIRGQYGHETGAMIAGVLVGLVLVFLFCPRASSLPAARAVALCAVGISFGGSMTYGQTLGLTHDPALVGNHAALAWGLLGVFIKGAIWIGFAGAFLGMGLSGKRYRPRELGLLLLAMIGLLFLGVYLLNEPFDPANRQLPKLYFSDHWHWEPEAELRPRRERWGGLLAALIGLIVYVGWKRKDRLARNLALWGMLGGGLGFALGQSLQAFHAWHPEVFREGWFASLEPHINWWNMMETTFGAVFGAILALGLWVNRRSIAGDQPDGDVVLEPEVEWALFALHVVLISLWNLGSVRGLDLFADLALTMGIIPIVAVAGGRLWPYLLVLPVVAVPIAGKTVRQLVYREEQISPFAGWSLYLVLPLLATLVAAILFAKASTRGQSGRTFSRYALLLTTWLYVGLNFAFFHYPWPWAEWTSRTPNAIVFGVCALGLTLGATLYGRSSSDAANPTRTRQE